MQLYFVDLLLLLLLTFTSQTGQVSHEVFLSFAEWDYIVLLICDILETYTFEWTATCVCRNCF
jgi:hypothetical protein